MASETQQKNHLHFGLIGSLIIIVLSIVQYMANISSQHPVFRWLPTVVLVVAVIWACINFSKINNGDVTFGEVFSNGFKTTAVMTVLTALFLILFVTLFPDFKERLMDEAAAVTAERGGTPEQIEQGIEMMRKNFMVFMMAGVVFMTLITGVVVSLVGAAIAKKKK